MNSIKQLGLALTGGLTVLVLMAACASANKNLDTKLSEETQVTNRAGLQKQATDLIVQSTNLTDSQKAVLIALRDSTRKQMDEIQSESIKLRAVLIQDVLTQKYNPTEVALIKKRMAKLDSQRTSIIFDTVEKANNVLGREYIPNKDEFFMNMIDMDHLR